MRVTVCLVLAAAGCLHAPAATAVGRTLAFPEVVVEAAFERGGDATVEERITYRLDGEWRGGVQTRALDGLEWLADVEVAEEGRPYAPGDLATKGTFAVTRSDGAVEVRWRSRDDGEPPYRDALRTFTVRYRVRGLVRPEGEVDEISWRALFADREAPVGRATVLIRLPGPVDPAGLSMDVRSEAAAIGWEPLDPRTLRLQAAVVPPGDPFEVRVGLPPGLFDRSALPPRLPSRIVEAWGRSGGIALAAALPVIALVVMLRYHRRHGVDPEATAQATDWARYAPDLPPALVGTVLDEAAGPDEVAATIVDLARRGYLKLQGGRAFSLERLRAPDDALLPYERRTMELLFTTDEGPVPTVSRAEIRERVARRLVDVEIAIAEEAARRRLFAANPETIQRRLLIAGFAGVLLGSLVALAGLIPPLGLVTQALGGVVVLLAAWSQPWHLLRVAAVGLAALAGSVLVLGFGWLPALGLGLALAGGVVAAFAHLMPRRTRRGAAERARWREFARVVGDHGALPPAQAERLLPYAIAAGVRSRTLSRLTAALQGPVAWYAAPRTAPGLGRWRRLLPGGWGAFGGRSGGGGASRGFDAAPLGAGLAGLSGSLASALRTSAVRVARLSGRGARGGGGGRGW